MAQMTALMRFTRPAASSSKWRALDQAPFGHPPQTTVRNTQGTFSFSVSGDAVLCPQHPRAIYERATFDGTCRLTLARYGGHSFREPALARKGLADCASFAQQINALGLRQAAPIRQCLRNHAREKALDDVTTKRIGSLCKIGTGRASRHGIPALAKPLAFSPPNTIHQTYCGSECLIAED